MATVESVEPISFVPSRVDGFDSVSLVTVEPTRISLLTDDGNQIFTFAAIAQRQDSWFARAIRRVTFRKPWPPMIGERDWFHAPPDRFFRFFTDPQITIFMPSNDVQEYAPSVFCRAQWVWRSGGFDTWDLG